MWQWATEKEERGARGGGQTKDPIEMSAVPESIEEAEVDEDGRDEDDRPCDGDGCITGVKRVREWDNHLSEQRI